MNLTIRFKAIHSWVCDEGDGSGDGDGNRDVKCEGNSNGNGNGDDNGDSDGDDIGDGYGDGKFGGGEDAADGRRRRAATACWQLAEGATKRTMMRQQ